MATETYICSVFQGAVVFCIITKLLVTENQFQGRCKEVRTHKNDDFIFPHLQHCVDLLSAGVLT